MPSDVRRKSIKHIVMVTTAHTAGVTMISPAILVLLAIKAGAGEIFIGLLSFATLAPMTLALITLPQIESHSKKRIVIQWSAVGTALVLPMFFLPQLATICPLYVFMALMFTMVFMKIGAEGMSFAAWFPLLHDIIPSRITGRFFGNQRTAWQTAGLISMLLVAWFLGNDPQWWKFNVLFAVCILLSILKLIFMYPLGENPTKKPRHEQPSIIEVIKTFHANIEQRKVLTYLLSYSFAFGMSVPFQLKFMKDLGWSDGFILAATAMVSLGAVLSLRRWGKLADRFGNRSIFSLSHIGMIIVTALWLLVQPGSFSSILIFCLFLFTSFFHSGNGIAQIRYIMHSIPPDRQRDITIISMLIILTMALSQLFAGFFLKFTSGFELEAFERTFGNYHLLFATNAALFLISIRLRKNLKYQKDTPTVEVLVTILRPRFYMLGPFQRFVKSNDRQEKNATEKNEV